MSGRYLKYLLQNGFVNHWLVAGPLQRPVQPSGSPGEENERKAQIAREMEDPAPGYSEAPVERQSFSYAGEKLTWRYFRCADDHQVDVSSVYPLWTHSRTWAYTRLVLPKPVTLNFTLSVSGPAMVWVNGKPIFKVEDFNNKQESNTFSAVLDLENDVLVRFDQVGVRQCENWMALRIVDLPEGLKEEDVLVRVPTSAKFPHRHHKLEGMLEKAYLEDVANYQGVNIKLHWAEDTNEEMRYAYQIQDDQDRIYVEGTWDPDVKEPLEIGHPNRIFERPYWVVLKAPGREYWEQDLRYERRMPLYILDNEFSDSLYGDMFSRRQEALEDAARREGQVFAEIAKMAIEQWGRLDYAVIQESIARMNRREAGSPIDAAGLLSILYRYLEKARLSDALTEAIENAILGYAYWVDEPGSSESPLNFTSESQAILFHACEILAGQRYPDRLFANSGMKGSDHRVKGEQLALDWLRKRGRGGFIEWDSNTTFETNIGALALLTSLAENEQVRELAAVVLDKILFLIAVNSYKGVYGSTHGITGAAMVKSARLEATSAVTRLLWGLGIYSMYIFGMVSLATSEYEYPSFFANLATLLPEELWSKERHVADVDAGPGTGEINKVTYKTPDYMLGSAQDFRAGQNGSGEHIWQATMGPDAIVFANHPACMSEGEARLNGFWRGNGVLPRVAQWKDVLISVHNIPLGEGMGFTHAFFPTFAFDEWEIKDGWAFARKGKGYLAITAMHGIELMKHGPDGFRELRSYGDNNIWICHMGRDAVDGYFSTFQREILARKLTWKDLAVGFTSLRGEELAFGWEDPLTVNGQEQPITGFQHIENPYCSTGLPAGQMDISYADLVLRLNFQ